MASSLEYAQFLAEQLSDAGEITYKKMFGEYALYCDELYFALICDNRFLLKVTQAGKKLLPDCELQLPYEGSKQPMFLITELDNKAFLKQLVQVTCAELPPPKPKKRKAKPM